MAEAPETTFLLKSNFYPIESHKFWVFLFFWDLMPEAVKKKKIEFVGRIMKISWGFPVESFKENRILISLYSGLEQCLRCHYILGEDVLFGFLVNHIFL